MMLTFWKESWNEGGGIVRRGLEMTEVVLVFPNGDKVYVTALENGVRIRSVQAGESYPLQIRPEAANTVRVELGQTE